MSVRAAAGWKVETDGEANRDKRELGHRWGKPHYLFIETRRSVKRAIGAKGLDAVKPTKAYDPSVGSEEIVAQMISELCREHPLIFLNHLQPSLNQQKAHADVLGRYRLDWYRRSLIELSKSCLASTIRTQLVVRRIDAVRRHGVLLDGGR